MLLSEQAIDTVSDLLQPQHFYRDTHGALYAAIIGMRRRGDPVEPLLVSGELARLGVLEQAGGTSRLAELAALVPSTSNVGHYASLVLETARARKVYTTALAIRQAASNGGLAMHPEVLDEMELAIAEARILPGEPGIPEGPVFVSAHDFIAKNYAPPEPLLGTEDTAVIAVGSLGLLAGRPGSGKTTILLDLICHLAAGIDWPPRDPKGKAPEPWHCQRPLKVALIENEGPQQMFKAKLEDKLKRFPHSIREAGGAIMVQSWRWGAFSFADRDAFLRVQHELEAHEIDLVVGDPLLTLGPEGVGSPRETSDFVQLLVPLGLKSHRAFLFLHHFRENVDKTQDELARLSGAWGGHLDTLVTLGATGRKDHLRFAYPKLRWSTGPEPPPIILGKVYNTRGFEALSEEGDATLLEVPVAEYLADQRASAGEDRKGWRRSEEVAKAIGARRKGVELALAGAGHLFCSVTGQDARDLGAKSGRAILWGLCEWGDTPAAVPLDTFAGSGEQESFDPPFVDDSIPF